jgi:hypothetical protein
MPARRTRTQVQTKPTPNGFKISNEAGYKKRGPSWAEIETVVNGLKPDTGNRFAILDSPDLSFVQTWVDKKGWWVEWRIIFDRNLSCWRHLRAYRLGVTPETEFCTKEEALSVFKAFFNGCMESVRLEWRDLKL